MKKLYQLLLWSVAGIVCSPASAQVSAYYFAQSNGTYTPISGGTVVATATANTSPGNLASTVWNLPNGTFPFTFVFNGVGYTGCNISCNGYITFGVTPPATTGGSPISATTAYDGAVSAWGRTNNGAFNLGSGPYYTSELRVEIIGSAPNRTVVIQYQNWRYASGTTTTSWLQDFQIRLIETTNVIEIVYGSGVMAGGSLTTSGFNAQVGLRGATNADYNNRSSFGLFNTSTTGTINTASQVIGVTSGNPIFMPPTGLTYRWYPRCNMGTLVTPTVTAITPTVCEGDTLLLNGMGATPYIDVAYSWLQSGTPGGPYSPPTGPTSNSTLPAYHSASSPGVYYYVLVSTCPGNSTAITSNEISVDVKPLPHLSFLSNPALNTTVTPVETCFGQTYTFVASGAANYTWTGGPATDSYVVQPAGNPVYTITGETAFGCISNMTIPILVNPLPVISTLASPTIACPGKPVVIGATGTAITYTWLGVNSHSFLVTVTPTTTTTYTVMGTSVKGCTNSAVVQQLVHTVSPLVASANPSTICKGESATLVASGAGSYSWSSAGTFSTGFSVVVTPNTTTAYTLTGTDVNGCESTTTVVQFVNDCLGLSNTSSAVPFNVYPNPGQGIYHVEFENASEKQIEICDVSGRVIMNQSTASESLALDLTQFTSGIYYLRVRSGASVQVVKVIKG